jgi:hypothetical protein
MKHSDLPHEPEALTDGVNRDVSVPSEDILDDSDESVSDYKLMESERLKRRWENLLTNRGEFRDPISEVDQILRENGHPIEAHIGGHDYLEASRANNNPDELILRIDQTPEAVQNIENNFFQQMEDREKQYHIAGTPIVFELRDHFNESIPLEVHTEYLDIHAPTEQAYMTGIITSNFSLDSSNYESQKGTYTDFLDEIAEADPENNLYNLESENKKF